MSTASLPSISKPFQDYRRLSNETEVLIRAISPLIEGSKILVDIGAGAGFMARPFSIGRKIVAIEAFHDNAAKLRKLLPSNKHCIVRDFVENAELARHSVDAVLCCHALYYVRDVREVVCRVFRWLKPGGVAVFVLLGKTGDQSIAIRKYWKHYHNGTEGPDPSSTELADLLREFTPRVEIKKVRSLCRIETLSAQAKFLSFVLDVPLHKLLPATKSDFKRLVGRKADGRGHNLTTNHDIIFCRSRVIGKLD